MRAGVRVSHLRLETELANCFAVTSRLFGCSRAGELDLVTLVQQTVPDCRPSPYTHIVGTELIEGLRNLDLLLGIEICIGKLFAFS